MVFLFRFKVFCVSILLISLAFTTFQKFLHKKKKQNQTIPIVTERPSLVGLQLNVASENDKMISFNTVVIFSIVSISFFMIWTLYSSSTAGSVYPGFGYNMAIAVFLTVNITPPLYFFNNLSRFKIAISIVHEMFS